MEPYASQLFAKVGLDGLIEPLTVRNDFFGGNVNVTGLLCACDVADAIERDWSSHFDADSDGPLAFDTLYFVPYVMFNSDWLTLHGWTLADIKGHLSPEIAERVFLAPPVPIDYMEEIAEVSNRFHQA